MQESTRSGLAGPAVDTQDEVDDLSLDKLTSDIATEIISLSATRLDRERHMNFNLISVGRECIWYTIHILALITFL